MKKIINKKQKTKNTINKVLNMMKTGNSIKSFEAEYVEAPSSRVLSGTIYNHKPLQYDTQLT